MSDPWNIKLLFDSRLRRDSQQQYFSQLSTDSGMCASPNGNAGTRYRFHTHSMSESAVGGHSTTVAGQSPGSAYPSTIHRRNPPLVPSPYINIRDSPIVASSMEMSPPSLIQGPTTSIHLRNHPVTLCPYTDIRRPPTAAPSMDRRNLPSTPYTEIRDPRMAAPFPTEMSSPSLMHGTATGQSPTTSDPSTRNLNPPFTQSSPRRFRCECGYKTNRKCDFDRHREGTHHEGKRHYCPFPNCTKSYTRQYTLEKHSRTHV
jgi:hypothetical protein